MPEREALRRSLGTSHTCPSLQWCGAEPETAPRACTSSWIATIGRNVFSSATHESRNTIAMPGSPPEGLASHAADLGVDSLLLQRAVVVEEVRLLRLDEPLLGEQEAERREGACRSDRPVAGVSRWRCPADRTDSHRRTGRDRSAAREPDPAIATTRRSRRRRRRFAGPSRQGGRPRPVDARR